MAHSPVNRLPAEEAGPMESPSQMLSAGMQCAQESISSHPATAVLSAFGAGIGLGLGLALIIGSSRPAPMIDPTLTDRLTQLLGRNMPWSR